MRTGMITFEAITIKIEAIVHARARVTCVSLPFFSFLFFSFPSFSFFFFFFFNLATLGIAYHSRTLSVMSESKGRYSARAHGSSYTIPLADEPK